MTLVWCTHYFTIPQLCSYLQTPTINTFPILISQPFFHTTHYYKIHHSHHMIKIPTSQFTHTPHHQLQMISQKSLIALLSSSSSSSISLPINPISYPFTNQKSHKQGNPTKDRRIMSNLQNYWPEPIVRVRSLSESGITEIPSRYVKPMGDRPMSLTGFDPEVNIPVIDLGVKVGDEGGGWSDSMLGRVSEACREWGFFQVVNHGVDQGLMREMREKWREFFYLSEELKAEYANTPCTYEGYGSRLGVEKGAILDWSDYYFLHYLPSCLRDPKKWPSLPPLCREMIAEYSKQVVELCDRLMKILSINLGLPDDFLQEAFGGEDIGACLRVNFYPKCPQPDLALGLSPHSDPGGLTILLPDENVPGLQVRRDDRWITVNPVPDAFIVNIGDQMQVLSNANYKSVEHRVIVNSGKERLSLAYFYNPKGDILIKPAEQLVTEDHPALYPPMTFNEYRLYIRTKGPRGKSQVEALKSPR